MVFWGALREKAVVAIMRILQLKALGDEPWRTAQLASGSSSISPHSKQNARLHMQRQSPRKSWVESRTDDKSSSKNNDFTVQPFVRPTSQMKLSEIHRLPVSVRFLFYISTCRCENRMCAPAKISFSGSETLSLSLSGQIWTRFRPDLGAISGQIFSWQSEFYSYCSLPDLSSLFHFWFLLWFFGVSNTQVLMASTQSSLQRSGAPQFRMLAGYATEGLKPKGVDRYKVWSAQNV